MRRTLPILLSLTLVAQLAATPAMGAEDAKRPKLITKLKRLYPRTVLVEKGKPRAVIVVAATPELRKSAESLQEALRQRTGATLPLLRDTQVVREGRVDFAALKGRNAVALGNVNNNALLRRLFAEWYVVADSIYPGKGGRIVRTVHDPFARGINAVALCGSDAAGTREAVRVFLDKHARPRGRGLVLPEPIVDVVFTARRHRFFNGPDKVSYVTGRMPQHQPSSFHLGILRRLGFADEKGRILANPKVDPRQLLKRLFGMGRSYFRRGDAAFPPLMKQLVERNRSLLTAPASLRRLDFGVAAAGANTWDRIEELPIWTDEVRLLVTNALLRSARRHTRLRPMHAQVRQGCVQAMDENHGTGSMVGDLGAWQYLDKYYDLPDGKYWLKVARACYLGQCSTFQVLEDASGYLSANPACSSLYALRTGDHRYFTRGIARQQARFIALACVSNLGFHTGFGDSPGMIPVGPFNALARAAWYYADPRLYWITRNALSPASGLRIAQRCLVLDLDVPTREPKAWTGVLHLPIYEMPLVKFEATERPVFAPKKPLAPCLFNKIVFKENWSPEGQYLLLDGASSGVFEGRRVTQGHSDADVNTIISFTALGRMWLMDHTYSGGEFQNHSGVYVTLNGRKHCYPGGFARLEGLLDAGEWGMTHTTFGHWDRGIVWRKGRWFAVLDRVRADKPGDYFARATFKALGDHVVEDSAFLLKQKGRFCRILSDGAANLSVEPRREQNHRYLKVWYPHAPPVPKYCRADKLRAMRPGETLGFIHVLYPYSDPSEAGRVELRPLSDHAAVVADGKERALVRWGGKGEPALIVSTKDGIRGLGARALGGVVSASAPCDLAVDGGRRRVTVRTTIPVRVTLDPAPASARLEQGRLTRIFGRRAEGKAVYALGPGTWSLQVEGWPGFDRLASGFAAALAAAEKETAQYGKRFVRKRRRERVEGLRIQRVRLRVPLETMITADLDGDGKAEWIVGGGRGVSAFRPDGKRLWTFATAKPVRALAAGDTDGAGRVEVAAGCDDERVYLLDAAGKPRWSFKCRPSQSPMAGPPMVDRVWIADLEGDGKAEVVAGAAWLHVIAADGKLKWERFARRHKSGAFWGDFRDGAVADLLGDKRLEVAAVFDDSYPFMVVYDAKGESVKGGREHAYPKPSVWRYYVDTPREMAAVNALGGKGTKQLFLATSRYLVGHWPGRGGARAGACSIKGAYASLSVFQPDPAKGAVLLTAGEMTDVCAWRNWRLDPSGRFRYPRTWARALGEGVTAMLGRRLGKRDVVFVGSRAGSVHVLDMRTGEPLALARLPGPPVRAILPDAGGALACRADGVVLRVRLAP